MLVTRVRVRINDSLLTPHRSTSRYSHPRRRIAVHPSWSLGAAITVCDRLRFLLPLPDRHKQIQSRGNGCDVCSGVDRVCDDQAQRCGIKHGARVVMSQHTGQASACHHAYFRANELNRRHQRKRDKRRPERRVAKLRSRRRVGADAGWIVVRGAGNQTGSENFEEPLERIGLPFSRFPPRSS